MNQELINYLDKKFDNVFKILNNQNEKQEKLALKVATIETQLIDKEEYISFKSRINMIWKIIGGAIILIAGAVIKKYVGT